MQGSEFSVRSSVAGASKSSPRSTVGVVAKSLAAVTAQSPTESASEATAPPWATPVD